MVKPCSFSFRWRPRVTCAVSMRWRIHVSSYPCLRQVGTCRSHQDVKPDSISEASRNEASMSISRYCSRVTRLASSSIFPVPFSDEFLHPDLHPPRHWHEVKDHHPASEKW